MTQGEIDSFTDEKSTAPYLDTFKQIILSSETPTVFLNISNFKSIPKTRNDLRTRLFSNLDRFKGNYLILFLIFIFIYTIKDPKVLILTLIWSIYFYIIDNFNTVESNFILYGYKCRKEYFLFFCIFISVFFITLFNSIIIGLLSTISIYSILVFIHMLFYKEEETFEDI